MIVVKKSCIIPLMKHRYLTTHIVDDLKQKMVFISGPRQVGKTYLGMKIAKHHFEHFDYLNWDARDDRKRFLANNQIILRLFSTVGKNNRNII